MATTQPGAGGRKRSGGGSAPRGRARKRSAHEPDRGDLRMVVDPHASDELRRAVSGRLDLFNVATTGLDEWHSVSIFLRDAHEEVVGGLLGETWGSWLHVTYLWVAEAHRGRGHATALLRAAERLAIEHGCVAARLETFSFQAPAFYAKQGYSVFGELDDCPPGHRQLFLRKTLRPVRRPKVTPRTGRS